MSASKEKRLRSAQRSEGVDKKAEEAAKKAAHDKKFRRNTIIVVVAVVIVVALAIVINSSLLYTKTTAMTIGDTKFTPAEFSYFYQNTVNTSYSQIQETYGDYASLIFDPSTPLDQQQYSDTQTWADYIYDLTVQNMIQITALYNDAMANGYTLTADDETEISNAMNTLSTYASLSGYSGTDGFLAANYCKGFDEASYEKLVTMNVIATAYANQVTDSFSFTDEELKEEYAANKDDYDFYDFYAYPVYTSNEKFSDMTDEEKRDAAKATAEEIASATNVKELEDKIEAFAGEDIDMTISTFEGDRLSSLYKDFLIDPARKSFDTTVVDGDSFFYAVMFMDRDDNNYHTVDTRHILVSAEADEDGNYSEDSLLAARTEAERLYALWQEDPTEEHFAELASQNTDDTASAADGGLYEQVYKNEFVTEYNDFLFNSDSKPGDTAIVYGESQYYSGYHIVYYVGENMLACDSIADQALRTANYDEYVNDAMSAYAASRGFGMRFANLR